jgi:hypothetical protein
MEKSLLESAYQGEAFPQFHGSGGQAMPMSAGAARGRFADDLLNLQNDATGLTFKTRMNPSPAEALITLDTVRSSRAPSQLVFSSSRPLVFCSSLTPAASPQQALRGPWRSMTPT